MNNPFIWGGRNYFGLFGVLSFLLLDFSLVLLSFTDAGARTLVWLADYGGITMLGLGLLGFLIAVAWPRKASTNEAEVEVNDSA